MPRTYTLCPHHGSFHHTNTASGQAMSLHFYCFVKTHPGNPHTLGPRASLQETSSFHPAQAAERRGVLNEPQKCLWHLQYYPWDLRTHDPTTPVRLATEIWLKRACIRPRRPGGKTVTPPQSSTGLRRAAVRSLPTPHGHRNPTRILAIRLTLRLTDRSPTPVGVPQSGGRDSCHLHFLLGSLFTSFRKALILADRHGAAQRAKRAETQFARELRRAGRDALSTWPSTLRSSGLKNIATTERGKRPTVPATAPSCVWRLCRMPRPLVERLSSGSAGAGNLRCGSW